MNYVPFVIEKTSEGERSYDIYSRMLKDRIIFLNGEITDQLASVIVSCLLYLNTENPHYKISLYINSPGGSINAGLSIIDTMNFISSPVETICLGQAMSMAAVILAAGEKGKRFALENSEIMIHQPSGGFEGVASDIELHSKRMMKTKEKMNELLSKLTGKTKLQVVRASERDHFMDSIEAKDFGIVDQILK